MFISVVVTLCHLQMGCFERVAVDTSVYPDLTTDACNNQAALAEWKMNHPTYRDDRYTIAGIRCVQGKYTPRGLI